MVKVLFGLFICLMVSISSAQASGWSAITSTCSPDDNVMINPPDRDLRVKYSFMGGMFQFQPWALSANNFRGLPLPISVRCMVLNPYEVTNPAWGKLIVSYQDPDGPGAGSRVVVKLVRVFRPSGFQQIAVFDSDEHAATGVVVVDRTVEFNSSSINFDDSDYVVGVHLYRRLHVGNPRVLRVRLDE